jgi:hypothetical protein
MRLSTRSAAEITARLAAVSKRLVAGVLDVGLWTRLWRLRTLSVVVTVGGDNPTGQAACHDAGDQCAGQKRRRPAAREPTQLFDQVAGLPSVEPRRGIVGSIGSLAYQLGGRFASLSGLGHGVQLVCKRTQARDGPMVLVRGLSA